MAATSINFLLSGLDNLGNPVQGGTITIYDAGTTNKISSGPWIDAAKGTTCANPFSLDANGRPDVSGGVVYVDGTVKLVLKDSSGSTVQAWDNMVFTSGTAISGAGAQTQSLSSTNNSAAFSLIAESSSDNHITTLTATTSGTLTVTNGGSTILTANGSAGSLTLTKNAAATTFMSISNSNASGTSSFSATANAVQTSFYASASANVAYIGTDSNHPVYFYTNGTTRHYINAAGELVCGTASKGTTPASPTGLIWVPVCDGAPSGTLTAPYTNGCAMIFDYTNDRLYVRNTNKATWKYVAIST